MHDDTRTREPAAGGPVSAFAMSGKLPGSTPIKHGREYAQAVIDATFAALPRRARHHVRRHSPHVLVVAGLAPLDTLDALMKTIQEARRLVRIAAADTPAARGRRGVPALLRTGIPTQPQRDKWLRDARTLARTAVVRKLADAGLFRKAPDFAEDVELPEPEISPAQRIPDAAGTLEPPPQPSDPLLEAPAAPRAPALA